MASVNTDEATTQMPGAVGCPTSEEPGTSCRTSEKPGDAGRLRRRMARSLVGTPNYMAPEVLCQTGMHSGIVLVVVPGVGLEIVFGIFGVFKQK